jgi:hypothetical protein
MIFGKFDSFVSQERADDRNGRTYNHRSSRAPNRS